MNRPLKRPGHPWPGQGGISPQTLDELIRRANNPKADQLPVLPVEIRWFRPMSDAEFEAAQFATGQDPTDDKPIDPLDANTLGLRALNRLTGDDVVAYCPSMWCFWVESDVEADAQDTFKMDPMERPIEVYFPMYSWTRNEAVPAANDKNISIIRRVLMSKRDKGKFPAMFNKRTGRWECISLTEAMPPQIWAIPSTTIPPATKIGSTARELSSGMAFFWVNEQIDPDVINDKVAAPNNSIRVYNWLTETSLKSGDVYLFWLDVQTGYYMVDPGADAQSGTGDVQHIMICKGEADPTCCVYDAVMLKYQPTSTGSYCAVTAQREKVWARCANGWTGNLGAGYCRLGVKVSDSLICNGDDRPVYMFDCGSCKPCKCPLDEDSIEFEFHAIGTPCAELFEPWAGMLTWEPTLPVDPSVNDRPGWWGVFGVTGMMPRMLYSATMSCEVPDPNNPGQTMSVPKDVFLDLNCGGRATGTPGHVAGVYHQVNGEYVLFDGAGDCEYTTGILGCVAVEGQFVARTYRMGVWVECAKDIDGFPLDTLEGPWIFWLRDEELGGGVDFCALWSDAGGWGVGDCCANMVTSIGTLYAQDCYQFKDCGNPGNHCNDCVVIAELADVDTTIPGNGTNECPQCQQCCKSLLGCWFTDAAGDPCNPVYENIPSPQISVTLKWPIRGLFDVLE